MHVTSTDGMTADYYPFDHTLLGRGATCLSEVRGNNRVTCDVTSKPPGTIEWCDERKPRWLHAAAAQGSSTVRPAAVNAAVSRDATANPCAAAIAAM